MTASRVWTQMGRCAKPRRRVSPQGLPETQKKIGHAAGSDISFHPDKSFAASDRAFFQTAGPEEFDFKSEACFFGGGTKRNETVFFSPKSGDICGMSNGTCFRELSNRSRTLSHRRAYLYKKPIVTVWPE